MFTKTNFYFFMGVSLMLMVIGCKKDTPIVYDVDPDFEEYVQRFIEKGAERGVEINFDDTGLLVEYSDVIVDGASGYCYLGQHHIVIDKSEWTALTDTQKEYLMFHELGHCELDRRHLNDQFDNLLWKSMMRGDPLVGNQKYRPVPYFGFRKMYYLDELFNQNTPSPDWSNPNFAIDDISETDKELILERLDVPRVFEFPSSTSENFEMEFELQGINNVPFITELTWGDGSLSYFVRVYRNFGTYIGVIENGKDHEVFFDPTKTDLENITVRQNGGFSQLYFDGNLVYHFDQLPNNLSNVKLEGKDGNGVLISTFSIKEFHLSEIL